MARLIRAMTRDARFVFGDRFLGVVFGTFRRRRDAPPPCTFSVEQAEADAPMSDLSERVSDRVFRELHQAEVDYGPRIAGEFAEAHIDAGARYMDGERLQDRRSSSLTDLTLQNQI